MKFVTRISNFNAFSAPYSKLFVFKDPQNSLMSTLLLYTPRFCFYFNFNFTLLSLLPPNRTTYLLFRAHTYPFVPPFCTCSNFAFIFAYTTEFCTISKDFMTLGAHNTGLKQCVIVKIVLYKFFLFSSLLS